MTFALSRDEVRVFEQRWIDGGVSGATLMENAGRAAALAIHERLSNQKASTSPKPHVAVVAGTGNNGGDGFVAARHLSDLGYPCRVIGAGDSARLSVDARTMLERLKPTGVPIEFTLDAARVSALLAGATVVVDAIFGTGLSREVAGPLREILEVMNRHSALRIALDLPSGLDADRGIALGACVHADITLTMAHWKRGLLTPEGAAYGGEVIVLPIGVPSDAISKVSVLERSSLSSALTRRGPLDHKGTSGHLLLVAGSEGKAGAAHLAARGALRGGAGLVTLVTTTQIADGLLAPLPEVMTAKVESDLALLEPLFAKKKAIVIGPGLGLDARGEGLLRSVLAKFSGPVVVDADAIALFPSAEHGPRASGQSLLFTPHVGELARLLGTSTREVESDRFRAVEIAARRVGGWVLLKGAHSLIAAPDGTIVAGPRGTPLLAVGGSGDILAGVLGALVMHAPIVAAASMAIWVHATAAAIAGTRANALDRGLLASEVADAVPEALAELVRT